MRRISVIARLVVGSLGAGTLAASPASAAICARWDPPERVAVGNSASVSFRTYVPLSTDGASYSLEPHPFPTYRFRVLAGSPTGAEVPVAMAPPNEGSTRWAGQFTPDRAGSWTLHIVNLADSDAACYEDAALEVTDTSKSQGWAYVLVALALLVVIGVIAAARSRRARSGASEAPDTTS